MSKKNNKLTIIIISILAVLFIAVAIVIVMFSFKVNNPFHPASQTPNSSTTKTDNQKINDAKDYSNQAAQSIISNNTAAATTQLQESANSYKSVSNKTESIQSATDSVNDEQQMLNSVPKVAAPTANEPIPGAHK